MVFRRYITSTIFSKVNAPNAFSTYIYSLALLAIRDLSDALKCTEKKV